MGSFKLKLVLYFALLALLPTAIAFYGFDTLAQRSETRRVDARLEAGLRGSLAAYVAQLDEAERSARAIAKTPQLQRALRDDDEATAAEIVAVSPNLTIRRERGFVVPGRIRTGAKRTVIVIDRRRVLGRLTVAVPLDDRLLRTVRSSLDPRDELVAVEGGKVVAGPHRGAAVALRPGHAHRVEVGGTMFRALATAPLVEAGGIEFVALTPQAAISAAARKSERRVVIGLIATLAIFALVTYLLGRSVVRTLRRLAEAAQAIAAGDLRKRVDVRGRDEFAQLGGAFNHMATELEQRLVELDAERRRLREATARFGDALAATHDVDQLLRVVVESAVEATGAYGGLAVGPQGELARVGDPEAGLSKLELPLTVGKQSFGRLILAGPSFGDDEREAAATLVSQAVVALENARLHRIVERQAHVDALTELANRRALEETLRAELARAERFNGELCLVLADLDWFKDVNDRFGHPFGDIVLREFARVLRATVREIDVAGRWGGEEFALILLGTDATGGAAVAERARTALAATSLRTPDGEPLAVTASFGVAAFPACADVDALVAAADTALYRAKAEGKDRVAVGEPGPSLSG